LWRPQRVAHFFLDIVRDHAGLQLEESHQVAPGDKLEIFIERGYLTASETSAVFAGRVERAQFVKSAVGKQPFFARHARQLFVVEYHHSAVLRQLDVGFHRVYAELERLFEGKHGVLRIQA
jgi:hypothetical protein